MCEMHAYYLNRMVLVVVEVGGEGGGVIKCPFVCC